MEARVGVKPGKKEMSKLFLDRTRILAVDVTTGIQMPPITSIKSHDFKKKRGENIPLGAGIAALTQVFTPPGDRNAACVSSGMPVRASSNIHYKLYT